MKITGVIGNTFIARDTRKDQIFFLNKRNIKSNILSSSIDQAFKGATGIGKYGFAILNIEMPAYEYDVNVHPTKMEVRFNNEDKIYRIVYHAVKSAMLSSEFLGNNEKEEVHTEYIQNELNFVTNNLEKNIEKPVELIKREEKRHINYKYIGIIFRTYIVIEIDSELYLIDQHAAHERVLYEQIKENFKNKLNSNTQMLLIPQIVTLSHKEMTFVTENEKLFENAGFDLSPFGDNTIKISGIPDLEYRSKTKNVFMDILDEMMSSDRTYIKDVEERFIATVACKAAVKANMDLTRQEVDNLLQMLFNLNNPYTCPHGRPTTIKYEKNFLDKQLE